MKTKWLVAYDPYSGERGSSREGFKVFITSLVKGERVITITTIMMMMIVERV